MDFHWNFYDKTGICVWSEPAYGGESAESVRQFWDEETQNEESAPHVENIVLEPFNGEKVMR